MPKEILFKIAIDYSFPEIINFCLVSKRINNLVCENQKFWMLKLSHDYNIYNRDIPGKYKSTKKSYNYKNYYQYISGFLNNLKNKLEKYKNHSEFQKNILINNELDDIVEGGDLNLVKMIIEKGAVNFNSALVKAARSGHLNIVKYLLEEKKVKNEYYDPLIDAAQFGYLDIVKYLVKKGHNVDIQSYFNRTTALELTSKNNHTDVVKYLLDQGADRNNFITSNLNTVKYLAEEGIEDINEVLLYGIENNYTDNVQFIVENDYVTKKQIKEAILYAKEMQNNEISTYLEEYLTGL